MTFEIYFSYTNYNINPGCFQYVQKISPHGCEVILFLILFFLFLVGILVNHKGSETDVLVSEIVSKPTDEHCGKDYDEI